MAMACSNIHMMQRACTGLFKTINTANVCARICRSYSTKEIKRFYKNVNIAKGDGGYEINLDKFKLRTPMGRVFRVPNEALAIAVATEWDSQQQVIRRSTMYLTSLSNTAIDNPTQRSKETIINSIVEFLDTDTICYRVEEPVELAALQQQHWDALVNWFQKRYNVDLAVTSGLCVPHIPAETKDVFRQHLNSFGDWALIGYQQAVECIKSFIIATAVIDREVSVEQAVELARLEVEFQIGHWGNVEWYHDVDRMELQARLASAAIFVYLNSNEAKTVFNKRTTGNPV